ncbi:MAG TPA: peptidoglycan DD-metalloendopeptidase family protein [Pyrinomonadaceae bacterium]|jgi:murein DD-endopeptidase MepM/ murein hydrolase activator NlpD
MIQSARWRTFLGIVVGLTALVAVIWFINRRNRPDETPQVIVRIEKPDPSPTQEPTETPSPEVLVDPSPSPLSSPIELADPSPTVETGEPAVPGPSFVGSLKLIVPVAGVKSDQLLDTFAESRSEGRVHDAIDIPAAAGTPVLAAADGEIIKLFQSDRGGTTIYQLSMDRKLVYYYAHLQRYADGLGSGKYARQGEVIGYVGDTGNAGVGNYHLHFSIAIVADPKRYWEGTNINPYPILRGQ